jgi:Spy/CpxP family protein refolding chaperone
MERKGFLAAAVGAATAVVATGFAAAAAPPMVTPPTMVPRPYPTPTGNHNWRNQQHSDRNITRTRKHLEHVIDELNQDQRDYDGHREKALDLLQRARTELLAAEQYDRAHPNG